jgi:phage shock protein C
MNTQTESFPKNMERSDLLLRSRDGIIAGVCKGIAQRLEVDPWLIRLIWLASVLVFGAGLALYIILALGLTREDLVEKAYTKKILGVCLRIAQNAQVDVGMVRVLTLISAFMSLGVVVLAYVVLHFFMPWPNSQTKKQITDGYQGHPIG